MGIYTGTETDKPFVDAFNKLTYRWNPWEVWNDFVIMFSCALSNPVDKTHCAEREERYLKIINKYEKQEQDLFPQLAAETILALERNPEQDFLGHIFMLLNLGNGRAGQVFTPYHVCELMAKITVGEIMPQIETNGFVTINDCACGAGATLIAGIHEIRRKLEKEKLNYQNHVLFTAQDIDSTVALMCYIQLSLLGVAGFVKIGNSLTEPMCSGDSLENYWFTPMYFSEVWTFRRIFRGHLFEKGGDT